MKAALVSIFDKITFGKFANDRYEDDDYDEDYDDEDYDDYYPETDNRLPISSQSGVGRRVDKTHESEESYVNYGKTIKLHKNDNPTMHYLYPKTLEEAAEVCNMIKTNRIVHVDLTDYKGNVQRIVDCMGGMIYALEGNITRSSDKVFIITTRHVNIEGDRHEKERHTEDELGFAFRTSRRAQ